MTTGKTTLAGAGVGAGLGLAGAALATLALQKKGKRKWAKNLAIGAGAGAVAGAGAGYLKGRSDNKPWWAAHPQVDDAGKRIKPGSLKYEDAPAEVQPEMEELGSNPPEVARNDYTEGADPTAGMSFSLRDAPKTPASIADVRTRQPVWDRKPGGIVDLLGDAQFNQLKPWHKNKPMIEEIGDVQRHRDTSWLWSPLFKKPEEDVGVKISDSPDISAVVNRIKELRAKIGQ